MTGNPVDQLPAVQYLILDVLAARWRTGVHMWTFPTRMRPHVEALADAGLVWWRSGPAEKAIEVGLTDAGKTAVLVNPPPLPMPATRETVADIAQTLLAAADGRREYAAAIADQDEDVAGKLEMEASTIAAAARFVAGDLSPMFTWLPSHRWTAEMHAALEVPR